MTSTAVDVSARASVLGIKTQFKNLRGARTLFLPQRIAVIGVGQSLEFTYPLEPIQLTSPQEVLNIFGICPFYYVALKLFPRNGDGVGSIPVTFYPLADDPSAKFSGYVLTYDPITDGDYTIKLNIGGIVSEEIFIPAGTSTDAASILIREALQNDINAANFPVRAVLAMGSPIRLRLFSKWKGANALDLRIGVEIVNGPDRNPSNVALVVADDDPPFGGGPDPDIQFALDNFNDKWETLVINCLSNVNIDALNKLNSFGESRWQALNANLLYLLLALVE